MDPNLPADVRRIPQADEDDDEANAQLSKPSSARRGAFPFLSLPTELRLRIYELVLLLQRPIDLDPANTRRIAPRLDLLLTSRQLYNEAHRVFYGSNTFRLFPLHGQFFHTTAILLRRLPVKYRNLITSMELRFGPGWTLPPKCWNAGPRTCLKDCKALRTIRVFVECDPSDNIFKGFRASDDFYTKFASALLRDILAQVPSLEVVELDAFPSVSPLGPLVQSLVWEIEVAGRKVAWGPERRWNEDMVRQPPVKLIESIVPERPMEEVAV